MSKWNHVAAVGAMVMLAGCAVAPPRLTHETVVEGKVVVEWPRSVKAVEVDTVEVDGRTLTVAPMPRLKLVEP